MEKRFQLTALILILTSAAILILSDELASAAAPTGMATLTITPEGSTPYTLSIRDDSGTISGTGQGIYGGNNDIYLQKMPDGTLQGYSLGRFYELNCNDKVCADRSATDLNFQISHSDTDSSISLTGTMDGTNVQALVADDKLGVSADATFGLMQSSDGIFSGNGSLSVLNFENFNAQLTSSGSLKGLKDLPTFIVFMIAPFVR